MSGKAGAANAIVARMVAIPIFVSGAMSSLMAAVVDTDDDLDDEVSTIKASYKKQGCSTDNECIACR